MKLSELVALRERLQSAFDTHDIELSIEKVCNSLENLINDSVDKKYRDEITRNVKDLQSLLDEISGYESRARDLTDDINEDISSLTKKFFTENYETEFIYNDPDNIRKVRKLYIPKHAAPILMSRLSAVVDWRYPTLEIGCRDGEFTKHLTAGDPLYITDTHQEFLDSTVDQFNTEYQRRIRPYLIKDQDFSILPQGQFGFVFCWNYFNYMALDTVRHHLQQIFDLLRPGGKIIFSYNNGDMPEAAGNAERYYMTYIPKSMLVPMCEMIGYDVVDSQDYQPALSWIELQRPGTLRTVKAHQVMGTIKDYPQ